MANQKYFNPSYVEKLKQEVKEGIQLERFLADSFPYDEDELYTTPSIQEPEHLALAMNSDKKEDFQSAVALYRAYSYLNRIQASDLTFWVTLSLTDLFPYVQNRWKWNQKMDLKKFILYYYFGGLMDQALSNLWWSVYLSTDDINLSKSDKFRLTKVLFSNQTFRTRVFGTSVAFRYKPCAMGVLEYLADHPEDMTQMEEKGQEIAKHFNLLGAVRETCAMERNFFYSEMESFMPTIKK